MSDIPLFGVRILFYKNGAPYKYPSNIRYDQNSNNTMINALIEMFGDNDHEFSLQFTQLNWCNQISVTKEFMKKYVGKKIAVVHKDMLTKKEYENRKSKELIEEDPRNLWSDGYFEVEFVL